MQICADFLWGRSGCVGGLKSDPGTFQTVCCLVVFLCFVLSFVLSCLHAFFLLSSLSGVASLLLDL